MHDRVYTALHSLSELSSANSVADYLFDRQLLPAVVFCFSKKKVDSLADTLPHMDFTTASEKSQIHLFFDKAVGRLKGGDQQLPQILRLREMLKRGLGIHHAGRAKVEGCKPSARWSGA